MAVAALLFAAAIGAGFPPAAAPAAPMAQSAAAHHSHAMPAFSQGDTGEATAMAAHHPGVMTPPALQPQLAQTDPPMPASPCEKGCMACQHCGFCTVATLQAPSATPILYRMSYAMAAAAAAPASITPALPAEPPRV